MKKGKYITHVVFRKFKDNNQVVALFPYEIEDYLGINHSYMHIGQHAKATYHGLLKVTVLAKPVEYQDLKEELESIGYDLKVVSKMYHNRWRNEIVKFTKKHYGN